MLATIRTRRGGTAVCVLVLVSTALRAWASRGAPTPWIAPDEMVYGLLGRGLYDHGALEILGEGTPYYSATVPALVGLPLRLDDLVLGHTLLKVLQALVMSLAAIPVYLWGRSLMSTRSALVAAALTLALPGLAYSGLVMSEVVFYPVFVTAAWALAAALSSPTRVRQAMLVAAVVFALATRLQAVVLFPVALSALALDALLARDRPRLRPLAPALAGLAGVLAIWTTWRLVVGGSVLAGYREAGGSYAAGAAMRFVGYHAADVALLTGLFPACALLLLLWLAIRDGERDPRVRTYLAVTVTVIFWLVLEVGVFASRELGLLAERNLIAAAPLLFLALALWIDRGGPGSLVARSLAGLAVAGAIALLPLGRLVVPDALPHSFTLIPLSDLEGVTSATVMRLVVALVLLAAALLFAAVPRRALAVLPAVLLVALVGGSVAASREVSTQAQLQQQRLLGPERRWVDASADGPVAYVYDGQAYWNAVWENLFWNRRIRWVYDLPGTFVPGPLPQHVVAVELDGELRVDGIASPARFAVVPLHFALRGEQVAAAPQFGTDRHGLGLWRLEPPLRLSTITAGLFENGDVAHEATLTAYDCARGAFDAVLLVKEPQTVNVFIDGRLVARQRFDTATTWHPHVPVSRAGDPGICKLKVVSNGLLGTTRFAFER